MYIQNVSTLLSLILILFREALSYTTHFVKSEYFFYILRVTFVTLDHGPISPNIQKFSHLLQIFTHFKER